MANKNIKTQKRDKINIFIGEPTKNSPILQEDYNHQLNEYVLLDFISQLAVVSDINEAYELCLKTVIENTKIDCGGIYEVKGINGDLELVFSTGLSNDFLKVASRFKKGDPQWQVAMKGDPIYVEFEKLPISHKKEEEAEGLQLLIVIPIIYDNNIIAVFNLSSKTSKEITYSEKVFLEIIGNQIGGTINRLKNDSVKYKRLFEESPNSIYITNSKGMIISCNKIATKAFGDRREDIIGKHYLELKTQISSEDKKLNKLFKSAIKGEETLPIELTWKNKNGSINYSIVKVTPLINNFNISGIQAVTTDITIRKLAEKKLQKTFNEIITTLSSVVDIKDPYTSGHQKLVKKIAVKIGKKLKLSKEKENAIKIAASLHDIGKINIADSIFSKPGKLSDIEYDIVKTHSKLSYKMLKKISFSYPVSTIVLQHHERENGSGYPNNLKSEDITIEAKILAVADVAAAMLAYRPYRPAFCIEEVIAELRENEVKLYDKKVVDTCIEVLKDNETKFKK